MCCLDNIVGRCEETWQGGWWPRALGTGQASDSQTLLTPQTWTHQGEWKCQNTEQSHWSYLGQLSVIIVRSQGVSCYHQIMSTSLVSQHRHRYWIMVSQKWKYYYIWGTVYILEDRSVLWRLMSLNLCFERSWGHKAGPRITRRDNFPGGVLHSAL